MEERRPIICGALGRVVDTGKPIKRGEKVDRCRKSGFPSGLLAAVFLSALLLVVQADPSAAQLATITFPDTAVGSSATVKCPTTTVSLCFGMNCSGSGTVQSVTGPSAPFSINKFNLLSSAEFFAGNCEAHPVSLPVTVGAGQILAYQATFSPATTGTFNGTLTFTTSGGPATVNVTGKGLAGSGGGTGQAVISLEVNRDVVVPGNLLAISYQAVPGTLKGNVDVYVVLLLANDRLLFFSPAGASETPVPFARNIAVAEARTSLFSGVLVDVPFGTYTLGMALAYTGTSSFASNTSSATFTVAPLSKEQTAVLQARGNPEFLVVNWLPEEAKKQESWFYYSSSPTTYQFQNGALTSQSVVSGPTPRPVAKVDPSLFSPQTTLDTLNAALGSPASVVPTDPEALPGYETVTYSFGLEVTLRNGRLTSARSVTE
jgi:hypothetical protein